MEAVGVEVLDFVGGVVFFLAFEGYHLGEFGELA